MVSPIWDVFLKGLDGTQNNWKPSVKVASLQAHIWGWDPRHTKECHATCHGTQNISWNWAKWPHSALKRVTTYSFTCDQLHSDAVRRKWSIDFYYPNLFFRQWHEENKEQFTIRQTCHLPDEKCDPIYNDTDRLTPVWKWSNTLHYVWTAVSSLECVGHFEHCYWKGEEYLNIKSFSQHTFVCLVTISGYRFRPHEPSSGLQLYRDIDPNFC